MYIKTFTDNELFEHLGYDDKVYKDIKKRIHYFNTEGSFFNFNTKYYYFCVFTSDTHKLVGVGKLKTGGSDSFYNPGYNNWIGFIEVDKYYRGRNISNVILEEIFKFAGENGLNILSSGYTLKGYI